MTEKYSGLAITPKELQKFMIEEQASPTQKYSLVKLILIFQGYSHSVEECSEIISDYEMKDTQVLSKVTNLYMGKKAFLRLAPFTHPSVIHWTHLWNVYHFSDLL